MIVALGRFVVGFIPLPVACIVLLPSSAIADPAKAPGAPPGAKADVAAKNHTAAAGPQSTRDSKDDDALHSGPNGELGLGKHNLSLEQLNHNILANPKSAIALVERGNAYLLDGDAENSSADFKKAIALDPRCAKAHIALSRCYQCLKKWPEAFAELQKAAQVATPAFAVDAIFEAAFLHRELSQYSQALAEYNQVVNSGLLSKKRLSYAIFQRGEVYFRTNKFDLALADANAAIKADPEFMLPRLMRARLYTRDNNFNAALADCSYIIKCGGEKFTGGAYKSLGGEAKDAYEERALIYHKIGRDDLAKKDRAAARGDEKDTLEMMPFRAK